LNIRYFYFPIDILYLEKLQSEPLRYGKRRPIHRPSEGITQGLSVHITIVCQQQKVDIKASNKRWASRPAARSGQQTLQEDVGMKTSTKRWA
jgi:hypothetical protein